MSTSKDYIEYLCERLYGIEGVTYKKMFGEFFVCIQQKPILLVCDKRTY